MTATARRLTEFKSSSGRYVAKRSLDRTERLALIKQRAVAVTAARKSRDNWKHRCQTAEIKLKRLAFVIDQLAAESATSWMLKQVVSRLMRVL